MSQMSLLTHTYSLSFSNSPNWVRRKRSHPKKPKNLQTWCPTRISEYFITVDFSSWINQVQRANTCTETAISLSLSMAQHQGSTWVSEVVVALRLKPRCQHCHYGQQGGPDASGFYSRLRSKSPWCFQVLGSSHSSRLLHSTCTCPGNWPSPSQWPSGLSDTNPQQGIHFSIFHTLRGHTNIDPYTQNKSFKVSLFYFILIFNDHRPQYINIMAN